MSFKHPKCKAFCEAVEQGLWILMAIVIFGLWCFSIWKIVEAL
jgi:hypothetical protein